MTTAQALRVFVFSHPRTACHVLFRLLATHPTFQVVEPFCCALACVVGTEPQMARSRDEWRDLLAMSEKEAAEVTWQGRMDVLQKAVAEAESIGKRALTMDHPHYLITSSTLQAHGIQICGREARTTPVIEDRMLDIGVAFSRLDCDLISASHANPTLFPDRFFFSFTPIITIRHPARVIPSCLRVFQRLGDDISHPDFPINAECFRFQRLVFDSFKPFEEAHAVKEDRQPSIPIVIDGDKLVRDPQGQMKKLCVLLGIDDTRLRYTWDPPREEHASTKVGQAFMNEFSRSTGIFHNPRAEEVNLEVEVKNWAKEWDDDTARVLENKVLAQMEDYEYLLQYSL